MKKALIVLVVVILAGGIAAALYVANQQNNAAQTNNSTSDSDATSQDNTSTTPSESSTTIVVTDDGFDKTTYTVKAGETVTVKNESSSSVQFSSADHPTHLEDPELNMDVIAPGESGTFVANTKGTHGFHDHLNDQHTSTLVVE
jgi:uncharacterized protein YxeA